MKNVRVSTATCAKSIDYELLSGAIVPHDTWGNISTILLVRNMRCYSSDNYPLGLPIHEVVGVDAKCTSAIFSPLSLDSISPMSA